MLTRPTTTQVLLGIVQEIEDVVLPHVDHEPARVQLAMVQQLLRQCAVRAGAELATMAAEAAAVEALASRLAGAPAVQDALAAYRASGGLDHALTLEEAVQRYDLASRVLSACIDVAFGSGDPALIAEVQALVGSRSANELTVLGQLDLVGRG